MTLYMNFLFIFNAQNNVPIKNIGNEIGNDGTKALAESLKENTSLTNLYLGSGKTLLQSLIQSSPSMNNIEDEGIKFIANSVKANTALTNLNLGYKSIHPASFFPCC